MSKNVKLAAAGVIILVAIVLYAVRSGGGQNQITQRRETNAVLRCEACGETFGAQLDIAAQPPFKCTKCGEVAAWRVYVCSECGEVFVPERTGDPPRPPAIPTCPNCNSQATGRAPVEVLEEE